MKQVSANQAVVTLADGNWDDTLVFPAGCTKFVLHCGIDTYASWGEGSDPEDGAPYTAGVDHLLPCAGNDNGTLYLKRASASSDAVQVTFLIHA